MAFQKYYQKFLATNDASVLWDLLVPWLILGSYILKRAWSNIIFSKMRTKDVEKTRAPVNISAIFHNNWRSLMSWSSACFGKCFQMKYQHFQSKPQKFTEEQASHKVLIKTEYSNCTFQTPRGHFLLNLRLSRGYY